MKNWLISILILLAVIVIALVLIADISSMRPGNRPANPYAYSAEEFRPVDNDLVMWRETGQIKTGDAAPSAFAYHNGRIYLAFSGELQVIDMNGLRLMSIPLASPPSAITVNGSGEIIVAHGNRLSLIDPEGKTIAESGPLTEKTLLTSVAVLGDKIYAADGSGRRVIIFNDRLREIDNFSGESGVSDVHGFIVPGGEFSLATSPENRLWIANPGLHALQNYTAEGRLRSYIRNSSFGIEGFSGCCNPSHFTFLPTGEFVTSEKGIIRIKVIAESGEVVSVVAPPDKFERGRRAPAIVSDETGNILALDFDRKMIRIFEPEKKEM